MEAWTGLIGVIAGAVIAFTGQRIAYRSAVRDARRLLLLEQCSQLVALAEDFRNRVWEERRGVASDRVAEWDLPAYRFAEARLRILAPSQALVAALTELDDTGAGLGDLWRTARPADADVDEALRTHRAAIEKFISASATLVRHA